MSQEKWASLALDAFDSVVSARSGFRIRDGQRNMAKQVAQTFAQAKLGKVEDGAPEPKKSILVVQAGTGVGKSLAYSAPAIATALARGTRVLISTATVALQEQLVNKDLPLLAEQFPTPFKFALAKGRGRFVCKLKLERLATTGQNKEELDDLFAEEEAQRKARPAAEQQARMEFYARMSDALAQGQWDGDRDSLDTPPEPEAWSPVAAEGSSCTGKHCPVFSSCTYYERRKDMVNAQVIVANHDLLLSSLGARLLPELDNCLLVLDEAHHLPQTALAQFTCEMDLSRLQWIDKLTSRALRVGQLMEVEEIAELPSHSAGLRQHLGDLARLVMDTYSLELKDQKQHWTASRARVPKGVLPEPLLTPLAQIMHHASGFLDALRAIAKALRAAIKDNPEEAQRLSTLYAQVGTLAPRLEAVHDTAQLLSQQPEVQADGSASVPNAKWFTLEMDGDFIVIKGHASPILPGATLKHHLWSQVRGAVLTSATLTSCGSFDFFLREAGLHSDNQVQTLEVASPFDYASQGILVAHQTRNDPREAQAFTAEMVDALMHDLSAVQAGALVLFTSREQMRLAVDALPSHMRSYVLVQNAMPRTVLLADHRTRVESGLPSIVFGMQSFGEGLDLPGALCESLFITKLPFAPPDDPVGESRAEWLRTSGRNPFNELVVPATAIRLAQWVGRAIRTEEDHAHVYCYDRRLVATSYGAQLLKGLPAFALEKRSAL